MKSFTLMLLWLIIQLPTIAIKGQNFYNTWYYNYDLVWEAGASAGIMNCLTDLGGKKGNSARFLKHIRWSSSKPCINLYITATYKDLVGVRINWLSGSVNAADSLLKNNNPNLSGRYGRNLSFKTHIKEFSLIAETHPLFWKLEPQDKIPAFSPYLLAGIGYYSFNPQTLLGNRWYDLQPLHLEGQGFPLAEKREPYQLQQFSVPVGAGVRYETGPLINVRLECIYRFLFTDYLDDVSTTYIHPSYFDQYLDPSKATIAKQLYHRMDELQPGTEPLPGSQRGNAKNKDAYFSLQLTLGYVFRYKVK